MYSVHMVVWVLLGLLNITVTIPVHSWLHCFIVQKTVRRMYKRCSFDVLNFGLYKLSNHCHCTKFTHDKFYSCIVQIPWGVGERAWDPLPRPQGAPWGDPWRHLWDSTARVPVWPEHWVWGEDDQQSEAASNLGQDSLWGHHLHWEVSKHATWGFCSLYIKK